MKEKINKNRLITFVKEEGKNQKCLTAIFKKYAKIHDLSVGSVRNCYYKTIKDCKKDNKLCNLLGVDSEMFPKIAKAFVESEEKELVKEILLGVSSGKSVRKAVYDISFGSEVLALRNQNKFRNLLKKNKRLIVDTVLEITNEKGCCYNPYLAQKQGGSIEKTQEQLYYKIKAEKERLQLKIRKLEEEIAKFKSFFRKVLNNKRLSKDTFVEFFEKNA